MKLVIDNDVYSHYSYENEEKFEQDVNKLADNLFGKNSIYICKKRQMKGSDIIAIPDAYLIDMTNSLDPKLFIIENEIVSHDPFKHIGIQLLKFATTFEESKVELRNYLMNRISEDKKLLQRLEESCKNSKYRNIDNYLDQAVYGDFRALIIIDEAREELHNVIKKINANISVLEFKAFVSESGKIVFQYDTLYEDDDSEFEFDMEQKTDNPIDLEQYYKRMKRRALCDTIVVPAKEDGFNNVFLAQNQWFAVRIGAAMKDRIKYIAAYQVAPISAITHVAEVDSILPYNNTGKYLIKFKDKAKEIGPIKTLDINKKPQGPIYVQYQKLIISKNIDELMKVD
jgi:hypothetical protein